MKINTAFLAAIILLLTSCTKDHSENPDYFAFGNSYGMCLDNCASFYMIRDKKLYPDDMDYYFGSSLKFKTDELPEEKYDLVQELIHNFPDYLLKNPDKSFGCPDCADQGAIHIEIQQNGVIKRWHFDTNISNLPAGIRNYVLEVSKVIEELK